MVPEKSNFTDCAEYRTRQTNMHGHECESDEDCEVYFLKPVNEYNIVDKIKEANKELFADTEALEECEESMAMTNSQRKVTFATNLEDYEPEEDAERASASVLDAAENEEDDTKYGSTANLKFSAIDEEEEILENNEEDQNCKKLQPIESKHDKIIETPIEINELDNSKTLNEPNETTEAVEEICEEIITMDMEESDTSLKECQLQQRHKMLKQDTFNHDNDDVADFSGNEDYSSDNKSPTNLRSSDSKEEESHIALADDEEDDDDQLSIIVASYIPEDFEKQSQLVDGERKKTNKFAKPKKIPFTKHFSFRRKSGNSKAMSCSFGDRHMPPPEVTDLKLNYKTCCEYRHAVQVKLPKYTGYLSEYGLTREQLAGREEKIQRKQRFVLEKALTANEQEMRKMQDNERAFTTWLKQKMRFPINKTRNMFDVKRIVSGVGCGSASAVRNRGNSGKRSS